jgi:hypothetical protein
MMVCRAFRQTGGKVPECANSNLRYNHILRERSTKMTEMVLNKSTLQETLLHLIPTERVMLREDDGIISLTPVRETGKMRGIAKGSSFTTEALLESRRADRSFGE